MTKTKYVTCTLKVIYARYSSLATSRYHSMFLAAEWSIQWLRTEHGGLSGLMNSFLTLIENAKHVILRQYCHLIDHQLCGKFFMLQLVFQPGALFRLTGIPSNLLTNIFVDGEAIFSSEINRVNERLSDTDNPSEMIKVVERFLGYLVCRVNYDVRPIDKTGYYLLQYPKNTSLDWLAREACLSRKQFYRNFVERMVVSPKLFARIVQLDKAVKLKNTGPDTDWLSIAIDQGYYDYQHLTRDFKEFTGLTPKAFYCWEAKAPERQFGKSEIEI